MTQRVTLDTDNHDNRLIPLLFEALNSGYSRGPVFSGVAKGQLVFCGVNLPLRNLELFRA